MLSLSERLSNGYFEKNYCFVNSDLYNDCLVHRNFFSKELGGKVVVLIHPFYPLFINYDSARKSLGFLREYLLNIDSLIEWAGFNDFSVAWVTMPELYVENCFRLINGDFTKAFFTKFGQGNLLVSEDINDFNGKELLIAGCYAEFCVNNFISSLSNDNVALLSDCVLFAQSSPEGVSRSNDYLVERYMSEGVIPKVNVKSLV